MPSDIPADVAYIGGVWCEGVLYGIHIVLFGTACRIFLNKAYTRGREVSSAILLIFSICMFALSTAHVALAVNELLQGFVYQRGTDGGPEAFFRQNVFPSRKAIYIINTLLGDSLLVWRVYVVWGSSWKICFPSILLLLGTAVCGIKTIVANATSSADSVFTSDILSWITSTFVLTIVTQVTATVLIASRIYYVSRLTAAYALLESRYMAVIWLVVESGAIYTSAAIIQLITYLEKMNAGVILEFMLSQISAMAPVLIVIRVGLGFASDGTAQTDSGEISTFRASGPLEKDTITTFGGSDVHCIKDQLDRRSTHSHREGQRNVDHDEESGLNTQ